MDRIGFIPTLPARKNPAVSILLQSDAFDTLLSADSLKNNYICLTINHIHLTGFLENSNHEKNRLICTAGPCCDNGIGAD